MIKGQTWLRTVAYVAPAVRPAPQAHEGPAPGGNAPPAQPSGAPRDGIPRDGTALTWAARRAGRGARRHWMLLILLAAGLGLRVVTQLAYRPTLFYIDSYKYLRDSGGYDPVGYNLLHAGPVARAMTGAGAIGSLFVFARRGTRRRRGEAGRLRGSPADRQLAVAALLTTLAAVTVVLGSDVYEFSCRLPASRPGHTAARGRVRCHGHRALFPAAAERPARAGRDG